MRFEINAKIKNNNNVCLLCFNSCDDCNTECTDVDGNHHLVMSLWSASTLVDLSVDAAAQLQVSVELT